MLRKLAENHNGYCNDEGPLMGPNKENLQIVHKRVELSGTCTDDKLLVDITTSFYYNCWNEINRSVEWKWSTSDIL